MQLFKTWQISCLSQILCISSKLRSSLGTNFNTNRWPTDDPVLQLLALPTLLARHPSWPTTQWVPACPRPPSAARDFQPAQPFLTDAAASALRLEAVSRTRQNFQKISALHIANKQSEQTAFRLWRVWVKPHGICYWTSNSWNLWMWNENQIWLNRSWHVAIHPQIRVPKKWFPLSDGSVGK